MRKVTSLKATREKSQIKKSDKAQEECRQKKPQDERKSAHVQESTDQEVVYQNRERIKKRFKPTVKPSQGKSYKFNMSQKNAQEKIRTVKTSTFDPQYSHLLNQANPRVQANTLKIQIIS